ncbi:MAG: penicillin acylase family protein [Myxococcota bacterium]
MHARRLGLTLAAAALLTACGDSEPDPGSQSDYRAEIRWTSYGIPHILADDIPSAAYGQGYAFAKLNGCILADQVVKLRGERASYFGPGDDDANIDSDFTHRTLRFMEKGEEAWSRQPDNIKELVAGYVAGYNAYLADRGDALPCGGEAWVQPITTQDIMAHYVEIATLAGARQLLPFIGRAQPPGAGLVPSDSKLPDFNDLGIGSNGWGIGSDRSASGRGMVFANPHFPWEGELKLYESQLTVPGEMNVYGASLMGVVGVLIGFNDAVGWTHTVSNGQRFTAYALKLDPSDPTRYEYDGQMRDMTFEDITIDVLEGGQLVPRTRRMWSSHWGPMLNISDLGGWTTELALTFRDANELNATLINQFHDMNLADSMEAFQQAHADNQGIPWVNTMSASADGVAWYADTTPTPNLTAETIAAWEDPAAAGTDPLLAFAINGVKTIGAVALDGTTSANEWVEVDGARDPGLIPFTDVPQIERSDFIFNANDSHWLTNPDAPLTGYSVMHGREGTPRTPRTRMNAVLLTEIAENGASGADGKFTLEELQAAVLSNRGMMAELLRDAVVERCTATPTYDGVDLSAACAALEGWNLRIDLDAPGALLWREFLGDFSTIDVLRDGPTLWSNRFDETDPVATPNTLSEAPAEGEEDRILQALVGALERLAQANLGPSSTLREGQFTKKAGMQIPMHGGGRFEGTTNLIQYSILKSTMAPDMERPPEINSNTDLTPEGYVVNYGTSFIMALEFAEEGPVGKAFLTYGQSDDPDSPFHLDQPQLFSEKAWRDVLYSEEDIAADPNLEIEELEGDREGGGDEGGSSSG